MMERIGEEFNNDGEGSFEGAGLGAGAKDLGYEHRKELSDAAAEAAYDELDNFEKNKYSEDLHQEWAQNFQGNPARFSGEENIERLGKMPMHKRLIFLAKTASYLTYTPDLAEKYFEAFPNDLKAIKSMLIDCGGLPDDSFRHHLFGISAPQLVKIHPEILQRLQPHALDQYLDIAERRNYAPSILLGNFEYKYNDSFKEFGKGADGLLKSLSEAGDLSRGGNYFIDPEQIFTPEYEAMSETQKASFLRKAMAELQFSLVFEETFNSCFTKESVDEMRIKQTQPERFEQLKKNVGPLLHDPFFSDLERILKEGAEDVKIPRHNVAHSMLFKTLQPTSVYEMNQEQFDWEMGNTAMAGGAIEEYPFHRLLLAVLDKIKGIEAEKDLNTDVLVDFWNKNRNPIFGNAVAEALIKQDINRAASGLLELLGKEKTDKNPLAAILYRLEFGRIGISEDGVKYLGKMYDLGELNNPDYFARRLTAKGDIGIFDDKKTLQKFFNLGDLSSEMEVVRPEIHDFIYQTLFFEKEGESKEERQKREQYLKEFRENYFDFYDDDFSKETGIRFNNLDFREQGWFLVYYKNADDDKKNALLDFAKDHGENGLKTFLSLEHGENNGDKILKIGEGLDSFNAGLVFQKYSEIAGLGQKNAQEFSTLFKDERQLSAAETERIASNTIKKANELLEIFSDEIDKLENKEKAAARDSILAKLESYQLDLVLTASVYKSLKQSGAGIELKDFNGVTFEDKSAREISPEELGQMLKIYSDNYSDRGYSDVHKSKLVDNLFRKINEGRNDVKVYMYKQKTEKGDKIMVFNAFENSENDKRRGTAFNADKSVAGSPIAKCFLETSLGMELANDGTVVAECNPWSPMAEDYTGRGFVVKGADDNYQGTGDPVFNIEISAANKKYDYKKYSKEQIIAAQEEYAEGAEKMILKFQIDVPELKKKFLGKVNEIAKKGYVMTRYIFDDGRNSVYCAFEKSRS